MLKINIVMKIGFEAVSVRGGALKFAFSAHHARGMLLGHHYTIACSWVTCDDSAVQLLEKCRSIYRSTVHFVKILNQDYEADEEKKLLLL